MATDEKPLPGLLGQIEDAIGRDGALTLAAEYGGLRITIPASVPHPDHWLAVLLGYDVAIALCRYFKVYDTDGGKWRGSVVSAVLPMGPTRYLSALQRLYLERLIEGASVRVASRELRIHERTGFRWRAKFLAAGLLAKEGKR